MKDLYRMLKSLKKQHSRDPVGLANDIFCLEVAEDDLKLAILKLMNRIKLEQMYLECLEPCNISSIWKMKGSKNDFVCNLAKVNLKKTRWPPFSGSVVDPGIID